VLPLVSLRRNIVEATFISVRWRRGDAELEDLAYDMLLPMERTARLVEGRFFDEDRVDGALQRARLASVLRFYFERAVRYGLFAPEHEGTFLEHLARLEKTGLAFRPAYEGYIVTRGSRPIPSLTIADARFSLLEVADLVRDTGFAARTSATRPSQDGGVAPPAVEPAPTGTAGLRSADDGAHTTMGVSRADGADMEPGTAPTTDADGAANGASSVAVGAGDTAGAAENRAHPPDRGLDEDIAGDGASPTETTVLLGSTSAIPGPAEGRRIRD
jgi:hypothetical protein